MLLHEPTSSFGKSCSFPIIAVVLQIMLDSPILSKPVFYLDCCPADNLRGVSDYQLQYHQTRDASEVFPKTCIDDSESVFPLIIMVHELTMVPRFAWSHSWGGV